MYDTLCKEKRFSDYRVWTYGSFTRCYFHVLIQDFDFVGRGTSVSDAPIEVLPYEFSQGGSTGEGDTLSSTLLNFSRVVGLVGILRLES